MSRRGILLIVSSLLIFVLIMPRLALAQPVISDVQATNITADSATITWTTDTLSDSTVNYGTSTALGSTASDGTATSHSVNLTGLSAETVYYYEVQSTDASGTTTDNNSGNYYRFAHIEFQGWGWCPHEQKGVDNVTFPAGINIVPRAADPGISDVTFVGALTLTYSDKTVTFDLDLSGVKARSVFYLEQHKVNDTGAVEWEAKFRGVWLTWEAQGQYLNYSGSISVMPGGGALKTTKPYFFELRMPNVQIPEPQLTTWGNYSENLDYIVKWTVRRFDSLLNELTNYNFWDVLGDMLDRAAVIIKEVREQIEPYIP